MIKKRAEQKSHLRNNERQIQVDYIPAGHIPQLAEQHVSDQRAYHSNEWDEQCTHWDPPGHDHHQVELISQIV